MFNDVLDLNDRDKSEWLLRWKTSRILRRHLTLPMIFRCYAQC
jgi:hypothetical protein